MAKDIFSGWFLIHRKLFDHDIGQNPLIVGLWVRLIAYASEEDREVWRDGQVIQVKRGELIASAVDLAKWLGVARGTLKRYLHSLEKIGQIEVHATNKYTRITIVNYDRYQIDSLDQQTNIRLTSKLEAKPRTDAEKTDIKLTSDWQQKQKAKEKERVIKSEILARNQRICEHLEKKLNTKITNWPKQMKALKMIFQAGYTEANVIKTIDYMADKDEFFIDKGFDLLTVMNQLPRYKAMFRQKKEVV